MRVRVLLAVAAVAAVCAGVASGAAVRFAATGDIAMVPGSGSESYFSRMSLDLTGDVVLGNLEGTLATGGSSKCGSGSSNCFAFRAPPSYAGMLRRSGFTIMNVANNHAFDYGGTGQTETLDALRKAGLRWTGRPGQITYLRIGKTTVAVIGFAPYPWAQSLTDIAGARRIVARAAANANLVFVTMHAGAEGTGHEHVNPGTEFFLGENRGNSLAFAHAVVEAGADLVIGSGPHVLRGLEWYHDRLIAYSLGNFLGNGTLSIAGEGGVSAVLQVSLRDNGAWSGGLLVPVRLTSPGLPEPDATRTAITMVRQLSLDDFGVRAMRISRGGILVPPG